MPFCGQSSTTDPKLEAPCHFGPKRSFKTPNKLWQITTKGGLILSLEFLEMCVVYGEDTDWNEINTLMRDQDIFVCDRATGELIVIEDLHPLKVNKTAVGLAMRWRFTFLIGGSLDLNGTLCRVYDQKSKFRADFLDHLSVL